MSNSVFIKKLLSEASNNIIRVIKFDNSVIPYSLLPKYNVTQTEDKEYITLYNLITDKIEDIKIVDIKFHSIQNELVYHNLSHEFKFVDGSKKAFQLFKKTGLPIEIFYKNFMNKVAIEYGLQEAVRSFDYLLDEDTINGKKIPKKSIKKFKKSFLKLIDEKLDENKNELLDLKNECDSEEDEEDINQILEMFDSCKDDICFDDVNTIKDILNQWPPLLLPLPGNLEKLLKISTPKNDETTKLEELADLISNLDSKMIYSFIEILDNAKEQLKESVYNDYKKVLNSEYNKKINEKL
jgi:hypothetical protein